MKIKALLFTTALLGASVTSIYAQDGNDPIDDELMHMIVQAEDQDNEAAGGFLDMSETHCFDEFGCGKLTVTPRTFSCNAPGVCTPLVITNNFSLALTVVPTLTSSGPLDVTISNPGCPNNVVPAGGSCTLQLTNSATNPTAVTVEAFLGLNIFKLSNYSNIGVKAEVNVLPAADSGKVRMFVSSVGVAGDMTSAGIDTSSGATPQAKANIICQNLAAKAKSPAVQADASLYRGWISEAAPAFAPSGIGANKNLCGTTNVINFATPVSMSVETSANVYEDKEFDNGSDTSNYFFTAYNQGAIADENGIRVTYPGFAIDSILVHSGTNPDGTAIAPPGYCSGFTSAAPEAKESTLGSTASLAPETWTGGGSGAQTCTGVNANDNYPVRLYCFNNDRTLVYNDGCKVGL